MDGQTLGPAIALMKPKIESAVEEALGEHDVKLSIVDGAINITYEDDDV